MVAVPVGLEELQTEELLLLLGQPEEL